MTLQEGPVWQGRKHLATSALAVDASSVVLGGVLGAWPRAGVAGSLVAPLAAPSTLQHPRRPLLVSPRAPERSRWVLRESRRKHQAQNAVPGRQDRAARERVRGGGRAPPGTAELLPPAAESGRPPVLPSLLNSSFLRRQTACRRHLNPRGVESSRFI